MNALQGAVVMPGASYTYQWEVRERSGPGPNDMDSIMWSYHSHVSEAMDIYSGLVGPMVSLFLLLFLLPFLFSLSFSPLFSLISLCFFFSFFFFFPRLFTRRASLDLTGFPSTSTASTSSSCW